MRVKHTSLVMELFKRQIAFIDSFETKLLAHLKEVIERNSFEIKGYIIEKQLFNEGIDGKNKKLKGYSRKTINYKISRGQPTNRTTLRDTGEFHESITIESFADRLEISSSVAHAKHLIEKYKKEILMPSNENMSIFLLKHFLPSLKQKYGQPTK